METVAITNIAIAENIFCLSVRSDRDNCDATIAERTVSI